jgi:hypothetical protein
VNVNQDFLFDEDLDFREVFFLAVRFRLMALFPVARRFLRDVGRPSADFGESGQSFRSKVDSTRSEATLDV